MFDNRGGSGYSAEAAPLWSLANMLSHIEVDAHSRLGLHRVKRVAKRKRPKSESGGAGYRGDRGISKLTAGVVKSLAR
jgi:hypothetical protein